MGALAHSDRESLEGSVAVPSDQVECRPERKARSRTRRATTRRATTWNVLAEELVAFPPATMPRSPGSSAPAPLTRRPAARPDRPAARPSHTAARPGPSARPNRPALVAEQILLDTSSTAAPLERTEQMFPRPAPRSRGLRRLLPGAATLAFLVGGWFGAGALSGLHHQQLDVMPGSVKVSGGYRYDARPGDTLWSIASKLQPGSDPRPLVSRLESQLHGAPLVAGDELTLP